MWKRRTVWLLLAAIFLCAVAWGYVISREHQACPKGVTDEALQKTIAALDATIEFGLKLSVSLVAAGAALLIGLRSGVRMTPWVRVLLLVSILFFGQSALAGIFWRLQIANAWFNECLLLVSNDKVQAIFYASFWFFIAGILSALIMVFIAAFVEEKQE